MGPESKGTCWCDGDGAGISAPAHRIAPPSQQILGCIVVWRDCGVVVAPVGEEKILTVDGKHTGRVRALAGTARSAAPRRPPSKGRSRSPCQRQRRASWPLSWRRRQPRYASSCERAFRAPPLAMRRAASLPVRRSQPPAMTGGSPKIVAETRDLARSSRSNLSTGDHGRPNSWGRSRVSNTLLRERTLRQSNPVVHAGNPASTP